jgi:hypothetical protein
MATVTKKVENVLLRNAKNYDVDVADGAWILICNLHQEFLQDDDKKYLLIESLDRAGWCESCRIEQNVTIDDVEVK